MSTVYVSSTFQDLREARQRVWRAIQDLNHQPVGMETYGADEKTVLERCAGDVESSGAYVLIVGWRYGWIPKQPGGKSITELEWEAAARANVRQFVYIQDDSTEPDETLFGSADRKRVRAFRERLRAPTQGMAGRFATVDELERRVLADLGPVLGRAAEFPPELRLTCDRQDPVVTLHQAWNTGVRAQSPRRGAIVVFAYGDLEQGHDLFAQRIARLELPKMPRRVRSPALPEPIPLSWCDATDAATFTGKMQYALWAQLSSESRQVWSAGDFVASALPITVGIEIPLDAWRKRLELLEAYAESWFQSPFDELEAPAVVLIAVRTSASTVVSSLQKLAARMSSAGRAVFALELDSVEELEVLAWTSSQKVQEFCKRRDAEDQVKALFKRKARWEMKPLMKKLEMIACKLAEGVGGNG